MSYILDVHDADLPEHANGRTVAMLSPLPLPRRMAELVTGGRDLRVPDWLWDEIRGSAQPSAGTLIRLVADLERRGVTTATPHIALPDGDEYDEYDNFFGVTRTDAQSVGFLVSSLRIHLEILRHQWAHRCGTPSGQAVRGTGWRYPRDRVIRSGESSGTSTGRSISAFFTMPDWVTNNCTVAHFLSVVLMAEDVAAVAVPYELAGGGQDLDRALELVDCSVVSFGGLSAICPSERTVEVIENDRVAKLVCSGTRVLYLAQVARWSGRDPRADLHVRKLLMAGEGASPAKRQKLIEVWGAATYSMFGMTETNTLAMSCPQGRLHLVENRGWFEVVDPDLEETLPNGEAGELNVTSLASETMPLLRYQTGDMCRIQVSPCPCGSSCRTLLHMGRVSDRVRVGDSALSRPSGDQSGRRHDQPDSRPDPGELRLPVRFTHLDINKFERSLRESVKPTIGNFQLRHQ